MLKEPSLAQIGSQSPSPPPGNRLDAFVQIGTAAIVFTIPWEGALDIPFFGNVPRALGVPVTVAVFLSLMRRGGPRRLVETHAILLTFAGWAIASYFWSLAPDRSLGLAISLLQLGVLVLLIWEVSPSLRLWDRLLRAWVLGSTVAGLTLVFGYWLEGKEVTRYRLAPEVHPNNLAFLLSLALPMAWYLSYKSRGFGALAYRLFLPLAGFAIVLSSSRSALFTSAVGLVLIPWTLTDLSRRSRAAIVAGLIAILVAGPGLLPTRPIERLATTGTELMEGDLNQRMTLWKASLGVVEEHTLLGVGAGASRTQILAATGREAGVHNTFLSILTELGVIGLAVFCLGLVALGWRLFPVHSFADKLGLILFSAFLIGLVPRHWEYEKPTWAILGMLISLSALRSSAFTKKDAQVSPQLAQPMPG